MARSKAMIEAELEELRCARKASMLGKRVTASSIGDRGEQYANWLPKDFDAREQALLLELAAINGNRGRSFRTRYSKGL